MQPTPPNSPNFTSPPPPGMGPDDVLFTVFRHRQLILGSFILGLIGLGIVQIFYKPFWVTEAKLNVPFIKETVPMGPVDPEARVGFTDPNGQSIIGTEIEILKSFNVASNAAHVVTPERILPKNAKYKDLVSAAGIISAGLEISPPQRASSLTIYFRHHDPSVVQPVLSAVMEAYKIRSYTVHNQQQFDDAAYQAKVVDMKKQIEAEEKELMETKKKLLVVSLDETKKAYQAQILKLSEQLSDSQRQLAERKAIMGDTTMVPGGVSTNVPVNAPTAEVIEDYNNILKGLQDFKEQARQFAAKGYKEAYPGMITVRGEIEQLTQQRADMIKRFPTLANISMSATSTNSSASGFLDLAEIQGLTKRVEFYTDQLGKLQERAKNLIEIEPLITSQEAQLELDRTNYHAYSEALARARNLTSFDASKQVSITTIEEPTPPNKDTKKIRKLLGAVFGGCLGLGLGLAFLIDFVLDRSIKRTVDIERHLKLPVFQSIPHTAWSGTFRLPWSNGGANGNGNGAHAAEGQGTHSLVHWDPKHHLHQYTEGLRERLMTYFEVNNVSKRPKLVGLTACAKGSGVTTLATGLAASLSKTGSGNVLFVDMNGEDAASQAFFDGKATCGINSALEPNGHSEAQVEGHLFAASGVDGSAGQLVKYEPGRIAHLMPKIKQSDYDYIIFDLPPVSQSSATPRLSSYMDITLLVLESERTAQQAAVKASVLMRDARANVATVLNKYRRHVPQLLSQDL